MNRTDIKTMASMAAEGKKPELLFWVGCAGSFDPRAQRIVQAFSKILLELEVDFAVLGDEEQCTGDPARRAGNEFVFQMVALQNIEVLNTYGVEKIVTACPHCFNILKNDYPALGGNYELIHHTQLLAGLLDSGQLKISKGGLNKGRKVSYHDSCYLGRANKVYEAPRKLLEALQVDLKEMKRSKSNGLCCGAGGAQMFKEEEAGSSKISEERIGEAVETGCSTLAVNCPFCTTMLSDGAKGVGSEMEILDISEMILQDFERKPKA